jgi:putative ABC transport system ATP-binding protein
VNRELGTTVAVITHNASIADLADRVLRMADGRVAREVRNERRASPSEISW